MFQHNNGPLTFSNYRSPPQARKLYDFDVSQPPPLLFLLVSALLQFIFKNICPDWLIFGDFEETFWGGDFRKFLTFWFFGDFREKNKFWFLGDLKTQILIFWEFSKKYDFLKIFEKKSHSIFLDGNFGKSPKI